MAQEEEQGIWGFKALKQMMKLLFKMSAFQEFTECYTQLLGESTERLPRTMLLLAPLAVVVVVVSSQSSLCPLQLFTLRRLVDHVWSGALLRRRLVAFTSTTDLPQIYGRSTVDLWQIYGRSTTYLQQAPAPPRPAKIGCLDVILVWTLTCLFHWTQTKFDGTI